VFQDYALYPHFNVAQNLGFGLKMRRYPKQEARARVREIARMLGIENLLERKPKELSGGQRQRVALGRALARNPKVFLFDEPLSNLDPSLRERTRRELRELIRRLGITTVLVTHEQDEAFDLGDRVAVLRHGRLEQVGSPDELYAEPANLFVGGFVGRSSVLPVMVLGPAADGTGFRVAVEGVEWEVDGRPTPTGPAEMLVRPESLRLAPPGPGVLPVSVMARRFTGPTALYTVATAAGVAVEVAGPAQAASVGDRTGVVPSRRAGGGIHLFPTRTR